jgi:cyclopropane fatty-acyl-phospholipid synthase-like methyltransferase
MKLPYNIFAAYYDTITRSAQDEKNKMILSIAKNEGVNSICDFGCGTGLLMKLFKKNNLNTFGCDLSDKMIEIAKINTLIQDDRILSVEDMTTYKPPQLVDIATCNYDSINYLLNEKLWKKYFLNVYSILNDNGQFIFDFVTLYDIRKCWPGYKQYHENEHWALLRIAEYDRSNDIGIEWFNWHIYQDGVWIQDTEKHQHASLEKETVRDLLLSAGFASVDMTDADSGAEIFDNETTRIEVRAYKKG